MENNNNNEALRNSYNEIIKYGFNLKDEYINEVLDPNNNDDHNNNNNDNNNFISIKKRLLEMDIRQILKPFFPLEINSSMDGVELKGPIVLQIVKVENITQPLRRRDENTQPRLLAIQVSDGTTKVTGIEIEQLSDINASTPPGIIVIIIIIINIIINITYYRWENIIYGRNYKIWKIIIYTK